ncbi:hypothetical protein B0H11DRAFT_2377168 [Mycena galericulata]|nr:hypothetical protein B0H11DRAFT_2377168 [Mycena galericulata]
MARTRRAVPSTKEKPTKQRVRKNPDKKPGKPGWVFGTKLAFFKKHEKAWRDAQGDGGAAVSKFYDNFANLFHLKYGYDMGDQEDLEVDVADPTDPSARHPDAEGLPQAEADRRSAIKAATRLKAGVWFRQNAGDIVKAGERNLFQDLLGSGIDAGAVRPQKPQVQHFYSRLHYKTRVKERAEAELEVEKKRCEDLELKAPEPVKVRGDVTREVWEEESEEFKKEVRLALEKEHTQAVRAWEMGRAEEPSQTKEELSTALKNAGHYLQPLAEEIRKRFGMNCTIMLCGPVGERGGAIEVRSVHAGVTRGVNSQKWFQFDRMAYRDVEASMVRFSEKCFTKEDCEGRVVETGDATGWGVVSSGENVGSTGVAAATSSLAGTAGAASSSAGSGAATATATGAVTGGAGTGAMNGASGGAVAGSGVGAGGGEGTGTASGAMAGARSSGEGAASGASASVGGGAGTGAASGAVAGPRSSPQEDGEPEPLSEAWLRTDMGKWSPELCRAHAAFALGEKWGDLWVDCVNKYIDFEAACGYKEEGPRIGGENRPDEVGEWIKGGRKWHTPPSIKRLGAKGEAGSFINEWWVWWRSLQPPEREWSTELKALSMPDDVSWGKLPRMCGPNGLMQVMATLTWWGLQETRSKSIVEAVAWRRAVEDVKDVLERLILEAVRDPPAAEKEKTKKRKTREVEDEDESGPRKRTRGSKPKESSPRKTRAGQIPLPRPKPRPVKK